MMSKVLKVILPLTLPLLLILQSLNITFGQNLSAVIEVGETEPQRVSISGSFDRNDRRNFWFLKDFGGYGTLGNRISEVSVKNGQGGNVEVRLLQPGEYLAGDGFQNWSYKIDLSAPKTQTAAAHVSWISGDRGLLMLDDILPQTSADGRASIEFLLPKGWQAISTAQNVARNKFEVSNIEKAVFFVGKSFRSQPIPGLSKDAKLTVSGDWQFTDEEAAAMVKETYDNYKALFGIDPSDSIQVALMKFPVAASPGVWEGDTRGSTVTILSSDMPFKTQALQRLHEQLRHEIFHLWLPNGVNLSGNYDWFYEGFALYASLKSGVMINRIRFGDFLDTLSRAYTIDGFQNPHMSLVEASQKRWSGANTTVYARGMIAAFLCDIALLKASKGKIDMSSLLKEVFNKYHSQKNKTDGNEAVLTIMAGHPELKPVVEKYIKGNEAIDWTVDLAAAGILGEEKNSVTSLKVVEKPDGRQKAMLDKLGYNNWRKN
jgi:hypothetical protein